MGQYYLLVNVTKKQFLYPHVFDDGLKAWEIVANGNMLKALGYLLVKSDGGGGGDLKPDSLVGYWAGDEILLTGDYDSSKLYDEALNTYTDLSTTIQKAMEKEGVFPDNDNWFSKGNKDYFKQNPVIPFDKLSQEGRKPEPVKTPEYEPIFDPDALEIL